MARGTNGDEMVEEPIRRTTRPNSEREEEGLEAARFFYKISAEPVTADPRVQQITVQVRADRGQVRLSAYRLRVKRQSKDGGDGEGS